GGRGRQPPPDDRLLPRSARGRRDRVPARLRRAALRAGDVARAHPGEGSEGARVKTGAGIELRWEAMLKGIHMQADWLRTGPDELLAQARELLDEAPPRIYLTGCGDPPFSGIGARP